MTEQEWLTSEDPLAMLDSLRRVSHEHRDVVEVSDRRLRLFSCACAILAYGFAHATAMGAGKGGYGVWDATGEADPDDLEDTDKSPLFTARSWVRSQSNQTGVEDNITQAEKAALLREIIGNPFRPVYVTSAGNDRNPQATVIPSRYWKQWLTPQVLSLAQAAYEERPGRECKQCKGTGSVPHYSGMFRVGSDRCGLCRGTGRIDDGTLDPFRLAVLADALEEAGYVENTTPDAHPVVTVGGGTWCSNILSHLRSPGPHVRGCWALDCIRDNK